MSAHALFADRDDRPVDDHIIHVRGATWADYQRHLELRGDRSAPRIAYLEGVLEIMSPSHTHEMIKSLIGCLVEVWCLENGIEFTPVGSWTLENKEANRGVEPDECYIFGPSSDRPRPDLAIEVIWTSGGLNKLEIYRAMGVREVWLWRKGRISVHVLRGEQYDESSESQVLPGIDLGELIGFLDRPTASRAIMDYRAVLRARGVAPRR
jgi:Uma2 family endonuclease